jgi:hypothetical protein
MKTIITGLLSKAYNFDNGKIAELFKDGETELSEQQQTEILNKILEIDAQRVENIKKSVDKKDAFQDGFKKAKSEVLTDFEKGLKEKFGVESDKTGLELVEEVVSKKSEGGQSGDITEDAIKRSKVFQDMESNLKKQITTVKTEYETKINEIQDGYKAEQTFSNVSQKALQIFNGLNPILPQNKTVADNQVKFFVNTLKDFKFDVQDERIVVMDKDGKVLEDGHGNSRSFEDIVKETASGLFEFKANNGGSGSGNGGQQGQGGSGSSYAGNVPKTFEELEKVMSDTSISIEDRSNIMADYEKAQKGI